MKKSIQAFVCLCMFVSLIAAPSARSAGEESPGKTFEFTLVANGKPAANVVVGGKNPVLQAAVTDLRNYVQQISGAELQVAEGVEDLPGPTLHLGETALYEKTAAAREAIEMDGFIVVPIGEDLVVAGDLPQGTANGIWTILQDQFGVRWYYPWKLWEVVPESDSLVIRYAASAPSGAYVENPSYLARQRWGGGAEEPHARRMRRTQDGVPLGFAGAGHHLNRVVNPEKYGDHPEYFAYFDGRRHVEPGVHPCFTNPDMFDVFMKYVREGGSSFGVNDNQSACKCERCRAVDGDSEPYQGMWNFSESFFQLMKRVAAQTEKEFPGRRLGVFAYQLTNAPPQTVDFIGDNVDVTLCQDTSQHFDPQYRKTDYEMSKEWVEKSGGVKLYDYLGISYWTPRYFPHIMAAQLKHLSDCGVEGYVTHSSTMADSSMPMFYLLDQMLWNADLDPDAVIDEMITDLYGEAAGPMRRFYQHWEQCWERQDKGKWFFGMDNFRGEMMIYSWQDIEKGRRLLEAAQRQATSHIVKQRIAWLQKRYAFTLAGARAHKVSTDAMTWTPGRDYKKAIALSNSVAGAWREWAAAFEDTKGLQGTPTQGWVDKTFRVRAWGLKQQMRDAALAPLVRWVVANETEIAPERLAAVERQLAGVALVNRQDIESRVNQEVGAMWRRPRADALLVGEAPRVSTPPELGGGGWENAAPIDAAPWVFHDRPENPERGKYDEPMQQFYIDPPAEYDLSATWQCAWDDEALYLRIVVRDDLHHQDQPAPAMWKHDSVQIGLNPDRGDFQYADHSWTYIWGGYRGPEREFGISLHGDTTEVHVWEAKGLAEGVDAKSLIQAKAAREGDRTVYEAAIDWVLLGDYRPTPGRSLGIAIVVNDVDNEGGRISAEYGGGVIHAKRPTEFSAVRFVEQM